MDRRQRAAHGLCAFREEREWPPRARRRERKFFATATYSVSRVEGCAKRTALLSARRTALRHDRRAHGRRRGRRDVRRPEERAPRLCGPRARNSWISTGAIRDSLASNMAFSAVPPIPMPKMPGGHQPAPMVGRVLATQSTILSEGFSMTNLDLFSEPPPFAATCTLKVLPGTRRVWITAGVLSLVFWRRPAGSSSIDALRVLSGWV